MAKPLSLRDLCKELRKCFDQSAEGVDMDAERESQTQPGSAHTSREESRELKTDKCRTDTPLDLAYATLGRLNTEPDDSQKSGVEKWNHWNNKHGGLEVKGWTVGDMVNLASIMSSIFFLDEFRWPVTFEWKPKNYIQGTKYLYYGTAQHRRSGEIHICVDPNCHNEVKKLDSHKTAIISTFLHELTHAYLFSFCCNGGTHHGDTDGPCRRDGQIVWPMDKGGNGHCMGWFLIACQIDVLVMKLIGINGHLFSFRSLISHCKGREKVSAGDWRLFFSSFDSTEVNKLYENLHDNEKLHEKTNFLDMLKRDRAVMQVWAEWGEKSL